MNDTTQLNQEELIINADCILRSLRMSGGVLRLVYDLTGSEWQYVETVLDFRTPLAEEAESHRFHTDRNKAAGNARRIAVSLDLKSIQWKSLYWDPRVIVKNRDTGVTGAVFIAMDALTRMFHRFLYTGHFPGEEGFSLYPYYTGSQRLALVYRAHSRYDGLDIVYKEMLAAFLYRISKPYWKKKHICLVNEKFSELAQDNGYYFFKHCMEKNEEKRLGKKIYYIITRDAPDRKKLEDYRDHLVDFMSLRHMLYLQAADLIVSTDSKYHSYALQARHSIFNRYIKKIPLVFLQHGVTALKRVDFFYGKGKRGSCEQFVVTSDFEKQIVLDNFGYEPEEVINTGFARWDVLEDHSQGNRELLIMPSWRNWLDAVPDKDFEESEYFRRYMELLNSRRFAEILDKYNLRVNFYLHAKFRAYIDTFRSVNPRIRLISFSETAVNELLMQCRMLVTDYSSVCWDVLYQDKPTLFYQFDLDKYEEAHGSYLDMRKDLFGDRAETLELLLDLLEEQVKNDFKMKPEYEAMRKNFFKYIDHNHSQRICDAIQKRFHS